jgi:hypothetical protein
MDFFLFVVEDCVEDVYDILIYLAGQDFIDVFPILYFNVLVAACHVRVQQFLFRLIPREIPH